MLNGLKSFGKVLILNVFFVFALFPNLDEEEKEEEENKLADGLKLGTLPEGISEGNETGLKMGAKDF